MNCRLFEPQVVFFSLTNSPATFQMMMNDIFQNMIAQRVVCVYLDDILIFTKTLLEHWKIMWRVLEGLQEHKLYLKPEKCEFEQKWPEYLRVIVLEGLVEVDSVKVSGVAEWPIPQNKKEVQSFVGFVNFYQRFIKDFSHYAAALFDLTKKDVRWKWGVLEQAAFNKLRELITSTPVLIFTDNSCPYHIQEDSSDMATGAVLSQQSSEDGQKWHLIAFFSKSLSPVKWNYEIHDRKMLAIIHALEEWQHYIEGSPCQSEVCMDYNFIVIFLHFYLI